MKKDDVFPMVLVAGIFFVCVGLGMLLLVAYANSGVTTLGIYDLWK